VYDGGSERFYALKTGGAVAEGAGVWRIGRSVISTALVGGQRLLRADLDLDVTGTGRVVGHVEMVGPALAIEATGDGPLAWLPLMVGGRGRAQLTWDGGSSRVEGRGYFDGNAADRPLDALGIADWRWGRVAFAERDLVYFSLAPEAPGARSTCTVLTIDSAGRARLPASDARFRDGVMGWFGLRRGVDLDLDVGGERVSITFDDQVEDGPFYQRYVVRAATSRGERGRGVAERVVPARLAQRWHRPLVNMRVDRAEAESRSAFLPLFAGASAGRVRRLLNAWLRGEPAAVRT